MPIADESFGATVIRLEGALNPAIVSPDWLLAKQLVDESDRDFVVAEESERMIATPVFSGGRYPWIVVEVTRDALTAMSTDQTETPERIREFVVGFFLALPETPIDALSVSHYWHVATGPERWQAIADVIAPREPWASVASSPDLRSIERRITKDDGYLDVAVEASRRRGYDLYVEVEHYWTFEDVAAFAPTLAMETLDRHWEETLQTSETVARATLDLA